MRRESVDVEDALGTLILTLTLTLTLTWDAPYGSIGGGGEPTHGSYAGHALSACWSRGTVNMRMEAYLPRRTASKVALREKVKCTGSHMLLCPLQNHTSPKVTSRSTAVWLEVGTPEAAGDKLAELCQSYAIATL